VIFPAFFASGALETGIDHATDANYVSGFETGDRRTGREDASHGFVVGHQGIEGEASGTIDDMYIRMAYTAVEDVDEKLIVFGWCPFDCHGPEGFVTADGAIAASFDHLDG
jgi:hypothetical protein